MGNLTKLLVIIFVYINIPYSVVMCIQNYIHTHLKIEHDNQRFTTLPAFRTRFGFR